MIRLLLLFLVCVLWELPTTRSQFPACFSWLGQQSWFWFWKCPHSVRNTHRIHRVHSPNSSALWYAKHCVNITLCMVTVTMAAWQQRSARPLKHGTLVLFNIWQRVSAACFYHIILSHQRRVLLQHSCCYVLVLSHNNNNKDRNTRGHAALHFVHSEHHMRLKQMWSLTFKTF